MSEEQTIDSLKRRKQTIKLQALFEHYNRRYWQGRLPRYTVRLSDKSSCDKRKRTIYINPSSLAGVSTGSVLLHEMAHAAVKKGGHDDVWLSEIRRLIRLGASLKKELSRYEDPKHAVTEQQLLSDFFVAGSENENFVRWPQVRRQLGYTLGYTDKHGRAISRHSQDFLKKARREFLKGLALMPKCPE